MKKILLVTVIILLIGSVVYAYRIPKPQRITDYDENGLVIINEVLEHLWDITNGRYTLNVTITNPDGTVNGTTGDIMLLSSGGNWYLEICVGGNVWRGVQLQDTP